MAGRWVYPVHRLDRGTSGVLVFALTKEIAARVAAAFATGAIDKRYIALTRGIVAEAGVIDHPIAKLSGGERKPARTEFVRLSTFERYSLVQARPLTGRLHQLRRHFKHHSHPIIGDTRYGDGVHNRMFRERFGLHRLALHAASLTLHHPGSGEPLALRAPLPDDLAGPLRAMELDTAALLLG
jgi:tRNA pseudouridine65 synthase